MSRSQTSSPGGLLVREELNVGFRLKEKEVAVQVLVQTYLGMEVIVSVPTRVEASPAVLRRVSPAAPVQADVGRGAWDLLGRVLPSQG